MILLYDLLQPALIVPHISGARYRNQTGGLACSQMEAAGALVPMPMYVLTEAVLATENLEAIPKTIADRIDKSWLDDPHFRIRMVMDRGRLDQSQEAWLHVNVVLDWYWGNAVLTWENSD